LSTHSAAAVFTVVAEVFMAEDLEAVSTVGDLGAVDSAVAVIAVAPMEVIGAVTEEWGKIITAAAMDSEAIVAPATGIAAPDIGMASVGRADIHHQAALLAEGRDFPMAPEVTTPPADGDVPGAQGRRGRALLTVGGIRLVLDAAPWSLA
jgi:hypothetical protein